MDTLERTMQLEGRTIAYDEIGAGPPIVFVHGVWATGGVWTPLLEALAPQFRCILPTLPLGVHRFASPADVDHSPAALARVVAGLIEALGLHDVTLVGNDTGGALCQLLIAARPRRIARVVLTNCDAFEVFPPRVLTPIYAAARVPWLWTRLAAACRNAHVARRFWSRVSHRSPDMALVQMLLRRFADDTAVREDLRLTIRAIRPDVTMTAARAFAHFDRPVLVLWGTDDHFFPVALGRRLAAAFPNARLELVPDAKLFVMVDQPDHVASAIAAFARNAAPSAVNAMGDG